MLYDSRCNGAGSGKRAVRSLTTSGFASETRSQQVGAGTCVDSASYLTSFKDGLLLGVGEIGSGSGGVLSSGSLSSSKIIPCPFSRA